MLYIVFHLSQSWFCAHAWYLFAAGVLFWYQLIVSVYLLLLLAWIHLILISAYCLCLSVANFGLNTLDFDISLLLSLVSNAKTDDYELVLCSCMISKLEKRISFLNDFNMQYTNENEISTACTVLMCFWSESFRLGELLTRKAPFAW